MVNGVAVVPGRRRARPLDVPTRRALYRALQELRYDLVVANSAKGEAHARRDGSSALVGAYELGLNKGLSLVRAALADARKGA